VAPHIDFDRGAKAYGIAYGALARDAGAELYVILGVGHSAESALYTVTAKDFETSLGVMKTDRELVRRLADSCGEALTREESAHRSEHSIEFQILFLQHLVPDWEAKRIVPVLCGSFHELLLEGQSPWENDEIRTFTSALRLLLAEAGRPWMIIAGVDLSHVGGHFGDDEPLSDELLARVRLEDEALLQAFERADSRAFFENLRRNNDERRVCGALALYTLLETLQPGSAALLHYEQCVNQESQTCVTVAAAALYESALGITDAPNGC